MSNAVVRHSQNGVGLVEVDIPFHLTNSPQFYDRYRQWAVPRIAAKKAGLFPHISTEDLIMVVSGCEVRCTERYIDNRWQISIGGLHGDAVRALCIANDTRDVIFRFVLSIATFPNIGRRAQLALPDALLGEGSDVVDVDETPGAGEVYVEGGIKQTIVDRRERSRAARSACLALHGYVCKGCSFNFEKVYGKRGAGFIHVHHTVPMAEQPPDYEVDPVHGLVPVCPNCHAIIHRYSPMLTMDQLSELVSKKGGDSIL